MSGKDKIKDIIVVPSLSSQTRDRAGPANDPEPLAPIPLIGTTGGFGKDANVVDNALSVEANLPVRGSQGVSGGSLERKVHRERQRHRMFSPPVPLSPDGSTSPLRLVDRERLA